jgi:hypothetical protein
VGPPTLLPELEGDMLPLGPLRCLVGKQETGEPRQCGHCRTPGHQPHLSVRHCFLRTLRHCCGHLLSSLSHTASHPGLLSPEPHFEQRLTTLAYTSMILNTSFPPSLISPKEKTCSVVQEDRGGLEGRCSRKKIGK